MPTDLAAERQRRQLRHLRQEIRRAACGATPAELIGLQQLVDDVLAARLDVLDARQHVVRLRDQQRDRNTARAA
jgi:hypothetical protein